MRNIEQIAEEEDAFAWESRRNAFRRFLLFCALVSGIWGWWVFAHGQMEKGAFGVVLSLLLFASAWGLWEIFRPSPASMIAGLLAGLFPFVLYNLTRPPYFSWGQDPSFWLSVHAGAVGEPAWSPLGYLLGQATGFVLPSRAISLLPSLSASVFSLAFFFLMQGYYNQLKNKTLTNVGLGVLVCWVLALSRPFWGQGTLGSGLVAGLGLLLFLLQRGLLNLGEKPWKALYLLLGLLWCVHPLWGLLGLFTHLGSLDLDGKKLSKNLFSLLIGLTPVEWVFLRADRVFPSWGGNHPFLTWLKEWKNLWTQHFQGDWGVFPALGAVGWILAILLALSLLLVFLELLKWKAPQKRIMEIRQFWIWVAAAVGGMLLYNDSSQTHGCVMLWFAVELGAVFLILAEKGVAEKKTRSFLSGPRLMDVLVPGLCLAIAASLLPGQKFLRERFYFPERHGLNLLQTLGKKSILVCGDPFEAAACREARLIEPAAMDAIILDQQYLNRRWYVEDCVRHHPEILFSTIYDSAEDLLRSLVVNNIDRFEIHWARSALPAGWTEPKAYSTVLTQAFVAAGKEMDPTQAQFRYDLTALAPGQSMDRATSRYFLRYATGFNALGKNLMSKNSYSSAIHAFERAAKLDPAFSEPQSWLASIYAQQNILEAAKMEFEKTIKNHPAKINVLLIAIGMAQKDKDDIKSVQLLDQIIRLNAELADAQYQLSKIYDKQGYFREAEAMLNASVSSNPQRIESQMRLGHLMARMGNRLRAEEAFRSVLSIDPVNKEAQVEMWKLLNPK